MLLRWLFLLVGVVLPGGSRITRAVRLDTGRSSPVVHVPRSDGAAEPVELDEDEVKEAVAQLARTLRLSPRPQEAALRLFEVDSRRGSYLVDVRSRRITPLTPGEHLAAEVPQAEVELTRAYLRWGERTERRGDCLGLLKEGPIVTRKYPLLTRSRDLTIREWLSTQSYAAQRDFGLLAVENIKKGIWR